MHCSCRCCCCRARPRLSCATATASLPYARLMQLAYHSMQPSAARSTCDARLFACAYRLPDTVNGRPRDSALPVRQQAAKSQLARHRYDELAMLTECAAQTRAGAACAITVACFRAWPAAQHLGRAVTQSSASDVARSQSEHKSARAHGFCPFSNKLSGLNGPSDPALSSSSLPAFKLKCSRHTASCAVPASQAASKHHKGVDNAAAWWLAAGSRARDGDPRACERLAPQEHPCWYAFLPYGV